MSKRRKKGTKQKYTYNDKLSYYENLLRFVIDGKKTVDDVLHYLDILSLKCLEKLKSVSNEIEALPEQEADDIVDFYVEFMDEFDEITRDARTNIWGENDAPILQIGMVLENIRYHNTIEEIKSSLSAEEQKEYNEYCDAVLSIKGEKHITYNAEDAAGNVMDLDQDIPGRREYETLPDTEKEAFRDDLIYGIAEMAKGTGGITIREKTGKQSANLYGIRVEYGKWEPIDAKETEDAYTLTPSGYRIAPEKGLKFCRLPERAEKADQSSMKIIASGKRDVSKKTENDKPIFRVIK